MLEIRSTRRTRSGHRRPPPLKRSAAAAETYPDRVYISAGRSEARRDSTSSTLRPTPNPHLSAPLFPAHLSRPSIRSIPLIHSSHLDVLHTVSPPLPQIPYLRTFHVPISHSSRPYLTTPHISLTHYTYITPFRLSNSFSQ